MEKEIDYTKVKQFLDKLKKCDNRKTDKELESIIIENYSYFLTTSKLYYKGLPLKLYCELNDLDYSKILRRYRIEKDNNPKLKSDLLISASIQYIDNKMQNWHNFIEKKCTKANVDVNEFYDYLKTENLELEDLNYVLINSGLQKLKSTEDNPYVINSLSLKKHCENSSINYNDILTEITILKRNFPFLTNEELVDYALCNSKPKKRQQEFYQILENIDDFVGSYNYDKDKLVKVIENLVLSGYRTDQLLRGVEKNYNDFEDNSSINLFDNLATIDTKFDVKTICLLHKINLSDLEKLTRVKYSTENAIQILYYIGDSIGKYNYSLCKDDLLKLIKNPLDILNERDESYIYKVYALYKCKLIGEDLLINIIDDNIYDLFISFIEEKSINDYQVFNNLFIDYLNLNLFEQINEKLIVKS